MTEPRRVQRAVYGSDGVFYGVGSVPPPEVAAEFGDHIWQAPGEVAAGSLLMPMVQAPTEPFAVQSRPVDPFTAPERVLTPDQTAKLAAKAEAPTVEAPPLKGPGSSVEAWRDYAAAKGVDVPEHAKRGEIVDALEVAGIPTE